MRQTAPLTLEPQDLDFLQSYFDSVRHDKRIDINSRAATDLASQIIELYEDGARNREELDSRISI
ncbi:hypothetical protein [Rhizobium oryzicola]|uniref:Uncharacterized protein n=1 Tax=Rhizobium oryzicola TaxID=1232668 RepID=A0ABT8T0F6_9HYPH|nr:hypothetical protein [Rhizobium oryzicola]MDO1584234.1 hypothetical protein [Rhizobium oryzicola]